MSTTAALSGDDRWAIHDLLAGFCHASDKRDIEALRGYFTEDAEGDLGPAGLHSGRDAIVAVYEHILTSVPTIDHRVGMILPTATAEGAYVESYFTAFYLRDDQQFTVGGRYEDRLVRTPAGWRIAARRLDGRWTTGEQSVVLPE